MKGKNIEKTIITVAIILGLLAVILGVFTFYWTRPAQRYQRLISSAEKYLADEDFEQALLAFEKAIFIDPKAVDAYIGKAGTYEQYAKKISNEDADKAILLYEKAIETWDIVGEIREDSMKSNQAIAGLYMNEGELLKISNEEKSYEVYQKAYDIYSEMAEEGNDEAETALEEIKKELESAPKKWEIIHHELKSDNGNIDCSYDELQIDSISTDGLIKAVQEYNEEVAKESKDSYDGFYDYIEDRSALDTQVLNVVRYDKKVLSIRNEYYWYGGGLHGDAGERYVNFETESGKRIVLKDIIQNYSALSDIAYSELMVQEDDVTGRGVQKTAVKDFVNNNIEDYWYLDEKGLVIFFPNYSITYYAGGTFKIIIPYDKYSYLFKNDYTLDGASVKGDSVDELSHTDVQGADNNNDSVENVKSSQNDFPSSKNVTDQITSSVNGDLKIGNKELQDIRTESPIEDAGSYYVLKDATYYYLGINQYGDYGDMPLVSDLTFYLDKSASITVYKHGNGTKVTAEDYYNAHQTFRPDGFLEENTVVMFPRSFDSSGHITSGEIGEFG